MVEVDGDGCVSAIVPEGLRSGKVEDDVAFSGLAGIDFGIAEERLGALGGGELSQGGEGAEEGGEIGLFNGVGGDREGAGVRGGDEGGVEVLEEEREAEVIGDAKGGEEVEVVLSLIAVEDHGVGLEDDVGGEEGGAGDGDVGGGVGGEAEDSEDGGEEHGQGEQDGEEEVAARGLGEGEVGHR